MEQASKHKTLIIAALRSQQGDDAIRARHAFRGMTPEQMSEKHGQSGRTRQQILDEYEQRDREYQDAIDWLGSFEELECKLRGETARADFWIARAQSLERDAKRYRYIRKSDPECSPEQLDEIIDTALAVIDEKDRK